jgi:hypothetical protein
MYSSSSWQLLQLLHCSDEMISLSLFMLVICVELESKPSDVSASTVKSLFMDVAVPIICNFGKRLHSGPLFHDFRILLALFIFVPNFSRGSWQQGTVFSFGFRVCIEHILWTWVFTFSRSAHKCIVMVITNIWTSVQYVCSFAILSSERVCFFGRAGEDDMGGALLEEEHKSR